MQEPTVDAKGPAGLDFTWRPAQQTVMRYDPLDWPLSKPFVFSLGDPQGVGTKYLLPWLSD